MKKFIIIGTVVVFFFGLLAGIACCDDDRPHPPVSASVSASSQLAIEDEAPVAPDDFASNDPPRVSANWIPGDESKSPSSPAEKSQGSGITLFTADDTWTCPPCVVQERILSAAKISFDFKKVKIPKEGQSPSGLAPCWQGADGQIFNGQMTITQLEAWAKLHGKHADPAKTHAPSATEFPKPITIVELDGSSSSAVLAALFEHINRSEIANKSSSGVPQAVQGWLPEIDVDLGDPMLKILDAMMSKDGYAVGGLKVSWPAGKRALVFDPPVDVAYRKILEVTSRVKSIEVNGREVLMRLEGRLIQDLKVKLK